MTNAEKYSKSHKFFWKIASSTKFLEISLPLFKKKRRNKTTCIYLKFYVITFDSLSMFSLEHFGIFFNI